MSAPRGERPQPKESLLDEATVEESSKDHTLTITIPGRMQEIAPDEQTSPIQVYVYLPDGIEQEQIQTVEIVLALHGQGATADFDADVLEALREQGAVVIAPTTSRRVDTQVLQDLDFQRWMQDAFAGKGFGDEVADFAKGIEVARAELRKRLGRRVARYTLMGDSLGATMAMDLAGTYHPERMILFSPSLDILDQPDQPLVGENRPVRQELLANVAGAETTVIRGLQDSWVTQADSDEIVAAAGEQGRFVGIEGAEHTFGVLPFETENHRADLIATITKAMESTPAQE